jgi:hypothetical protein
MYFDRRIPDRRRRAGRAQAGHLYAQRLQLLTEIQRGRVAFHAGIGGKDHFLDATICDAAINC